ncbi:3-deoxy-D-manno-octulosonic acid kinase [Vibrio splendidus]|uniref:3-deoxy-D-manno-octulosonic acid kinase n=1 Tax=Vibrio splendidus TaxID=29497 RepID=UPI001FB29C7E|nr:3-deoxy-D-manno-octulosonic acid kinase [Vibrio splendidus]UOE81268.1 3-deoxy-D-manno-octulosonic acid kinase [Vibrio splendidus]
METLSSNNQVIWFDESLISPQMVKQAFKVEYWQQQNKMIGSATGRGTTWFVELPSMQAALRHYRRGGLFGKLVEDSYIYTGDESTRSYQEFELLTRLKESGVNVPRPIAARVVKNGLIYTADLLSEKVPNARDLVDVLQENALPKEMYQKIGVEVRKMHAAQVNHTDLNIHNILIDEQGKVWIIDFDKCFQKQGESWKQDNWNRLLRSFKKEQIKRNIHWSVDEFNHMFG